MEPEGVELKRFTDAVERALQAGNWYGALSIALTLPDVCGRLETPSDGVGKRYIRWFEKYVQAKYTRDFMGEIHIFLSGSDCYALRCSYLHEGSGDVSGQRARQALDRFHFTSPPAVGGSIHRVQNGRALMLQVDEFCRDIVEGVVSWEKAVVTNPCVLQRKTALLVIHDSTSGVSTPF